MIKKLKIRIIKTIEFTRSTRGESIRYLFIGGCTTLVNFVLFALMTKLLHFEITVSNVTSIVTSILFAYIANKLFVFHSCCSSFVMLLLEFFKFVGSRLLTMAVEVGGLFFFVNVIGQDSLIGKAETLIVVIVGNYLISKYIVFRSKPGPTPNL